MGWVECFVSGLEFFFLGIGTFFDVKDRELPILFLLVFGSLGLICNRLWDYQSLRNLIWGVCFGGIFLAAGWISREQIGYGDGIGLVILGVFEGFEGMVPMVIGAFLLGGIYGLWCILGLKKSGKDTMPFFPFLLLAFVGVKLF